VSFIALNRLFADKGIKTVLFKFQVTICSPLECHVLFEWPLILFICYVGWLQQQDADASRNFFVSKKMPIHNFFVELAKSWLEFPTSSKRNKHYYQFHQHFTNSFCSKILLTRKLQCQNFTLRKAGLNTY